VRLHPEWVRGCRSRGNPGGTDFHLQGASGLENGPERVHGAFRIPFDQFVTSFTFLAIEEG